MSSSQTETKKGSAVVDVTNDVFSGKLKTFFLAFLLIIIIIMIIQTVF